MRFGRQKVCAPETSGPVSTHSLGLATSSDAVFWTLVGRLGHKSGSPAVVFSSLGFSDPIRCVMS